jgi:hypothetical protein
MRNGAGTLHSTNFYGVDGDTFQHEACCGIGVLFDMTFDAEFFTGIAFGPILRGVVGTFRDALELVPSEVVRVQFGGAIFAILVNISINHVSAITNNALGNINMGVRIRSDGDGVIFCTNIDDVMVPLALTVVQFETVGGATILQQGHVTRVHTVDGDLNIGLGVFDITLQNCSAGTITNAAENTIFLGCRGILTDTGIGTEAAHNLP